MMRSQDVDTLVHSSGCWSQSRRRQYVRFSRRLYLLAFASLRTLLL